jgi:hypothetical protein
MKNLELLKLSVAQLRDHFNKMRAISNVVNDFTFPVRITCAANSKGSVTIPISSNADFELEGYNISHSLGTAGAIDVIKLKFSQTNGNRKWSSDYENIACIATPGPRVTANPVPRTGMRQFHAYIPANDQITIDWENADAAASVIVDISFKGLIWMLDRTKLG